MIDAVLLLIVRCVLAGVEGYAWLEWLLGRVSEGLVWLVELGMLLVAVQRPDQYSYQSMGQSPSQNQGSTRHQAQIQSLSKS